jgi:hypothetical protein
MNRKHAYPHKSGIVMCDPSTMKEVLYGKAQQRFMARLSEDGD